MAAIAGDEIKPTVLELGGSDPFVVTASADLDEAARVAAVARCQNNGQSCIAAKRFIVFDAVADEFERRFVDRMAALRLGDPTDPKTDVGPLATERGRRDVEELVADAVARGATVLCGGERPAGPGWYYPPTVVTGVTEAMRMYHEEVFGPVAALHRARRRRRRGAGQRHQLRPGVERVEPRPRRAGALRARPRRRRRVRQRHDHLVPPAAVRGREALGVRPRARRPRHPRVLQREERVGRRARG